MSVVLLNTFVLIGQEFDLGIPPIDNYSPSDYKASEENWDIAYGEGGLVYFANGQGLLQYDGQYWKLFPVSNHSAVRCILPKDNKVFVGAYNELGFFTRDHTGKLNYTSLRDSLEHERRDMQEIWKIHELNDEIIFQTKDRLLIYNGKTFRKIECQIALRYSFLVHNQLYFIDTWNGLSVLNGDEVVPVPGTKSLAGKDVNLIMPLHGDTLLIQSWPEGFYKLIHDTLLPFSTNSLKKVNAAYPFCAIQKSDNEFIIGTTNSGIFILNDVGEIRQHIDRPKGLNGDKIFNIKMDKYQNLWIGLENGISYVHLGSEFTFVDYRSGLLAAGLSMLATDEQVYIGTSHAVYRTDIKSGSSELELNKISNTEGPTYCFYQLKGHILVGNLFGVYLINKLTNDTSDFQELDAVYSIRKIPNRKNMFITAGRKGLFVIEYIDGELKTRNRLSPFNDNIEHIEINNENEIWVTNKNRGVWKLKANSKYTRLTRLKKYGARNGLPENYFNVVTKIKGKLYFCTQKGLYEYDDNQDRFFKSEELSQLMGDKYIPYINVDRSNEMWYIAVNEGDLGYSISTTIGRFNLDNLKTAADHSVPFRKFKELHVNFVKPISKNRILLGTPEGCILFNTSVHKKYNIAFDSYISSVMKDGEESLYEIGAPIDSFGIRRNLAGIADMPYLPYEKSLLTFHFTNDYTEGSQDCEYQYYLDGQDDKWSPWSNNSSRQYTNLPSGTYTFHVRARNIYGTVSNEALFKFKVKLPWYQTVWAYTMEIGLVLLLLIISLYVSNKRNNSKVSTFIILLSIITVFESLAQIIEIYLDSYGGGIFVLKVLMNIVLAMSIGPLEYRIRQRKKSS